MSNDAKLLDSREILAIVKDLEPDSSLLGERLFSDNTAMTDKFIIERTNLASGIMDARADDAEAKMVVKDSHIEQMVQEAIDWSNTIRISASDVRHWREVGALPVGYKGSLQQYAEKEREIVNQEIGRLRTMLDNRDEWLRINAILGEITIDNNGVKATVDFGVPADQKNQVPSILWSVLDNDPILNVQTWQKTVKDRTGVKPTRLLISERIAITLARNALWAINYLGQDMKYHGMKMEDALSMVKAECGLDEIIIYDAFYSTRNLPTQALAYTRFLADDRIVLLPPRMIGRDKFAEMISTPHPSNGWEPGYYAWEKETENPWGLELGAGKKMWPVIYHPELIFWADVL